MRKLTLVFCSFCFVLATQNLKAQVVLELSDVVVNAGNTAVVTASISDAGANPGTLSAYNIPLEFSSIPGFSFAGASDITSATSALTSFSAANAAAGAGLNYDFDTSDSGGGIQLSSTPIALFDVFFSVDADAAAGSVLPVSIQTSPEATGGFGVPALFSLSIDGATFNADQLVDEASVSNGSITVVTASVPEPSSSLVVLFALGGLGFRRFRS